MGRGRGEEASMGKTAKAGASTGQVSAVQGGQGKGKGRGRGRGREGQERTGQRSLPRAGAAERKGQGRAGQGR